MEHSLSRRGVLKLVATAGAGLIAANSCPSISWADGTGLSSEDVKARLLIGSDLHIIEGVRGGESRDADKKLAFALKTAYEIAGGRLDAFALVGDSCDRGSEAQYKLLMELVRENLHEGTQPIFCMGNHECIDPGNSRKAADRFQKYTNQQPDSVFEINGVPVITMGPSGAGDQNYFGSHDWFVDQVNTRTNPNEPFVVLTHHQIKGSSYTSPEWHGTFDPRTVKFMGEHHNLIQVSGHSHATLEDERSISQDLGFTAIQDGSIGAYWENETGKIDPETGKGASIPPQTSEAYTAGKPIWECSQAILLDVMTDNTVKVYRLALNRTKVEGSVVYLYEPWVINVPALVASRDTSDASVWAYTKNRTSTKAPSFPTGANVGVEGVTGTSAHITFPTAQPGSSKNCDMVHEYRITAQPVTSAASAGAQGARSITKRVFNDYYRPLSLRRGNWDVLFGDLEPKTTYTVSVVAQTSWNKEPGSEGAGTHIGGATAPNSTSAPIVSKEFTTLDPSAAPRAILDMDFRSNKNADAMGHPVAAFGACKLVHDDELDAPVFEADGKGAWGYDLAAEDYEFMHKASTHELLFKIPQVENEERCIFSNQQGAGAGFETTGGQFQFWFNREDGRVTPSTEAEAGRWIHAIAVASPDAVTLYIDGQEVAREAGGMLKIPGPNRYFVGADVTGDNTPEIYAAAGTRVAFARIFPYAMTAEQVAQAYELSKEPFGSGSGNGGETDGGNGSGSGNGNGGETGNGSGNNGSGSNNGSGTDTGTGSGNGGTPAVPTPAPTPAPAPAPHANKPADSAAHSASALPKTGDPALLGAAIAGIGGLAALAGGAAKNLGSIAADCTENDIL